MKTAYFRFSPELAVLLPRSKREGVFSYTFNGPQSVKHLIESLGVPHTEIGRVCANGHRISLDYLVRDGDAIEVEAISYGNGVDEELKGEPRFVLDNHLGRLTAHLRMLGLDCSYRNDFDDLQLLRISTQERRILLTRDRRLLMHKAVRFGYLLRSLDPEEQLMEVVQRYHLVRWIKPFHRCLRCNTPLESVPKAAILERLEPLTKLYFDEFHRCPQCDQIYWKGSHYERMQAQIQRLKAH